jgi:hypothetical protein
MTMNLIGRLLRVRPGRPVGVEVTTFCRTGAPILDTPGRKIFLGVFGPVVDFGDRRSA